MKFNPLGNLSVNIKATGPAAILIVWCISITSIGLYGDGEIANRAMNILAFFGGATFITLAFKV